MQMLFEKMHPTQFSTRAIKEKNGLIYAGRWNPETVQEPGLGAMEGPFEVRLEFSIGGSRILLVGQVKGAWALPCSRCLALIRSSFEGSVEETYPLHCNVIDVHEEVRQALLLTLPNRCLCREDCRGLCPRCGKNLNLGACGCKENFPSPFAKLNKRGSNA